MKLCYPRARKSSIKGPYIFHGKNGYFSINLGEEKEVDDALGHQIISKDGDIIKEVSDELDPDSLEKIGDVPQNKMMPDPAKVKAEEDKKKAEAKKAADKKAKEDAAKAKSKKEAEATAKALAKEEADKKKKPKI